MADQVETAQSPEERMLAFVGDNGTLDAIPDKYADDEEEAEPQTEPQEAQGSEEASEETEADSQEQTEEEGTIVLTHNGKDVEVPIAEAKALAQQGYDYTQKTQKLAEERKQVENFAHAVKAQEQNLKLQAETQVAFIKEIAQVENINTQLAQYEKVDWNALSDSDPVSAQKHWIAKTNLENQRTQLHNELNQKHQKLQEQRAQTNQARLAEAEAALLKAIPDWNADKANDVTGAARHYGASDEAIGNLGQNGEAWMILALADAAKYRKLQAGKGNVTNKVQGKPPVVKPGAKDTKAASRTDFANTRQQLRKTGDQNLAAKLIERML